MDTYTLLSRILCIICIAGIQLKAFDFESTSTEREGHCIWYGVCNITAELPCSYNGSAVFSDNRALYRVMKTYCPEFIVNATHVETCCDAAQAAKLGQDIAIPDAILGRCPPAWDNLRRLICYMTCSPEQSLYMAPKTLVPVN